MAIQDLSSLPAEFTAYGSDVVFTAQNTQGYELWKYDGSAVSQIANINPAGSSHPSELTVAGGQLYFVASDGVANFHLWKYDGSSASKVLDLTGLAPIEPSNLTAAGGTLYFVAEDGINGRELWKTNGTATGTVMVKDVSPAVSPFDGPDDLVVMGSTLYFTAYDDANGWELWKSDGTTIGTQLVADVNPGEQGSLPQELTVIGSTLYFRADDGTNGEELWKQTGANPPELVKDVNPSGASYPRDLTAVGTKLYFSTRDATDSLVIWNSDGTALGTQIVETLHVGDDWDAGSLVEVDGDLYFSAVAPDERDGWELWKVDGVTLDSTLLATFAEWGQWADPWTLMEAGDRLYFASWDGTYGHELWTSDGSVTGTKRLTDINFRVGNSSPQFLSDIGGVVYFAANNGAIGIEPYSYDRTGIGLRLLANVATPQAGPQVSISMAFESDSGYENDDGITRVTRPTFVVDVNMPGQVQIDYDDNGTFEFSAAMSNWGTYEFTPTPAYANGIHTIKARFTANSISVEDDTEITVDTLGPSLVGTYPVENTASDYHSLFFSEAINEERIFAGDFLLTGPGIVTPISLREFFVNPETDRIDVGFAPLTTPGVYTVSVNNGLEDLAGNLLNGSSPTSVSFEVLADEVFLDDSAPSYVWDPGYENKDLVVDGTILEVSGMHNVSSLWLLNGAQVVPVVGQPLELIVAGKVVIDATSAISAFARGSAGGGLNTAGAGAGAGAAGTDGGGGGGHGGAGGVGGTAANAAGGVTHGSNVNPVTLGSGGGGSAASTGGAGGGAVKLDVGGVLILDGEITADGGAGTGVNASGGAGGSIWLIADSLQGDGAIRAEGGDAVGVGGGGGGGRIAVSLGSNEFTGVVSAVGGLGTNGARTGVVGTIEASPAFPPGASGPALAAAMQGGVTRDKLAPTKYEVRDSTSDSRNDAQRESTIKRTTKRNAVTAKNLPSGSYQVKYKGNLGGKARTPVSPVKLTPPLRAGVPRQLSFAVSAQIEFTPSLVWDGGGDGVNWTNALNWSTDVLPTANDTVSIPAGVSASVTITGTQSVKAFFSATDIVLSGSLTVSDVSQVTGAFTISAGATLTVSGPQASFEATGATIINGANLFAAGGGEILLPGVAAYTHAATAANQTRTWRATGVGSRIELPDLLTITNAQNNSDLVLEALAGGVIALPAVTQIADPPTSNDGNQFIFTADGAGSLIDLSSLTQLLDRGGFYSVLTVRNAGEIRVLALPSMTLTNLVLEKTGAFFSIPQIASLTDGLLTLSGANGSGNEFVFTNLGDITRTTVSVTGVDVALNAVVVADGANLLVTGGGTLTLQGITDLETGTAGRSTLRAVGSGSQLSLPNLADVVAPTATTIGGSGLIVEALDGGVVSLPDVLQIADSVTVGQSYNSHVLTADGLGSQIVLSALTQIIDRDSFLVSTMTSRNGGTIGAPLLTSLQRVNVTLDGTGTVSFPQLAAIDGGRLTLSGSNGSGDEYVFTNLTNILNTTIDVHGVDVDLDAVTSANGANLLVDGGVILALPGVVNFLAGTLGGSTFRATGPNSRVSLPNVPSVVSPAGTPAGGGLRLEALDGGVVSLPIVVQIGDSTTGDRFYNAHVLLADGLGSRIELPALTQIIDRDHGLSAITSRNNGTIVLSAAGTTAQRFTVTLSNDGTIDGSLNLSTAGSLVGAGTITGNLISSLTVNPAGTIAIGGNYTQTQSGILAIEISGHQSTDVDKLAVGGTANLNGQLQVTRAGGFVPVTGDSYPILTFASRQNDFALKTGLDLGNLKVLKPVFSPTNLTLFTTAPSGTGVFVDSGQSLGSTAGREVRLGDVNNDGDLDALVSSDGAGATNPLWVNNGAGVFSAGSGFASAIVGPALALGDVDNDNDLDVIAGFGASQPLRVYRNQGGLQAGTLGNFAFTAGNTLGSGDIRGVALADLDGDNDRDAFLAITGGGNQVWINQGGAQGGTLGAFVNSGQSLGSLNSVDVVLGDLDNDLDVDAATADSAGNTVVWRNNGSGTFTQIFGTPGAGTFVTMGDIDGDTDLDIITANTGSGFGGRIIRNTGGGTFNGATVFLGGSPLDMALGDVDGDGDLDVFAATGSTQADKVWFNNGTGTFVDSLEALGSATSHDVALGDLDGDGDLDAFVVVDGADQVWLNQPSADYGDAPDATYPTLATHAGASHNIVPGYFLGAGVDVDSDGQPHPFALGDDLAGTDDENGVVFADTLFVGVANSVSVTASAPGVVDGWIDFNNDGDWNDAGEKPFVSVPLAAGVNALNFVVPATATATFATFARFRFSSTGGLSPTGRAINGEVEDYFVPIRELDMGDAAASSFATLLEDNGARHMIVAGYHLGGGVDAEADGQPSDIAVGDADDGVRVVNPLVPGQMATVEVTASAPGMLDAWIDFDADGLESPGEHVFVSVLLGAGPNLLSLSVPASANVGEVVFGRFRFSSVGGLGLMGFAPNGEVEDYAIAVTNGLPGDANFDDDVDGGDFLEWQRRLGSSGPLSGDADYDGDGHTASGDLQLWASNYGSTFAAAASATVAVASSESALQAVDPGDLFRDRSTLGVASPARSDRGVDGPPSSLLSLAALDSAFAQLTNPAKASGARTRFAPPPRSSHARPTDFPVEAKVSAFKRANPGNRPRAGASAEEVVAELKHGWERPFDTFGVTDAGDD